MNNTMVKIEDAVVSYREDVALRGVSLEVKRGEFIGIIGPNGAGKTTLLTLINGLGKLLQGQVHVLGHHLNGHNPMGSENALATWPRFRILTPACPSRFVR